MTFIILTGPPGCGKTDHLLRGIVDRPGSHLLAAPRTALLDEHAARLRGMAREAGISITIDPVHSGQSKRGGVFRRIETTLRQYDSTRHVVVLVTHEALLGLDPALLVGWSVGIDEVPDGSVASGAFSASTSWPALVRQYRLEPSDTERWWRVVPRDDIDPHSLGEITRGASDQTAFHRLILRGRPVHVDLSDWEQARDAGRRVGWLSLWTVAELSGCASVMLTSASYSTSLAGLAHRQLHGDTLAIQEIRVESAVSRARPLVRIHYYVSHRGSTAWWSTDDGSRCLVEISRHLEQSEFDGYWSCNTSVIDLFRHRIGGQQCDPRQAGTNLLRNHMSCAYIYSNKAQTSDTAILEVLGLGREAIVQAREYEDVFQFAMRGVIRDPTYDGSYDIHLYSEDQAIALRDRLIESEVTDHVEIVAVTEAGISEVTRPDTKRRAPQQMLDDRTMAERQEEERQRERQRGRDRRAAARERDIAAGTARGRGRPKKDAKTIATNE